MIVHNKRLHERFGTVTEIVPMQGRTRGYATVMDETAMSHTFFDPQFLNKFPELKAGDRVKIVYTSGPSAGGWHIERIVNNEVLTDEENHA